MEETLARPHRPKPAADPGTRPREGLKLQIRIDRGQIVASPNYSGIGLVGLRRALGEPSGGSNADRHRDETREFTGNGALDLVDDALRIVAAREPGGELVNGVHSSDR